ncbi:MAG: ATP-binding protein [Chloroflexi bacterium]|nr:ATP-binding protein [Chloroflexota bacterium]
MSENRLGVVVDGTFNGGLTVRLEPGVSSEQLRIGNFVVVEGQRNRYFSLIADIQLKAADIRLLADPPRDNSPFVARALAGTSTYATAEVKPMLMLEKVSLPQTGVLDKSTLDALFAEGSGPQPVRTIPMHFAELREATELDFATVFGQEGGTNFAMGTPLAMDIPICLRLDRFVERSNGVFGQSGTGKSFLARLVISGIIKTRVAVNLIFDMHDEYSFDKQTEDGRFVKGLRQIFGSQVLIYSLDEEMGRRSGRNVDVTLKIGLNQIEEADIVLLSEELNLRQTAEATIGLLRDAFRERWLLRLLEMTPEELEAFSATSGAHPASVASLQRNLKRLQRQGYIEREQDFSALDDLVQALDRGKHVILQFGRYNSVLDYVLVSNLVTRRVRQRYEERTRRYEETQAASDKPRPLIITIEEAHKFLNPAVARQTTFGIIAREMRKYNVTLLVIDQRPSSIDPEVMSQLGTRVSGKLTEERDIEAVLTGVGNRSALRGALESLDTRQQILIMGHAVPMPIMMRTRPYDEEFYRAMGPQVPGGGVMDLRDLFEEQ